MKIRTKRLGKIRVNNKYTLFLSLTSELLDIGCDDGDFVSIVCTEDNKIILTRVDAND